MSRQIKQIIILIIFIAALAPFVFFGYLLIRTPLNCFDNLQNQDEIGVDCGGVCEKKCETKKKDLLIAFAKIIPTLPNTYNVIFKIDNPNNDYGIGDLKYSLRFLNTSGLAVGVYNNSSYILPRDSQTVVLNALNIKGGPISVEVEFGDFKWIKFRDYSNPPRLIVKDKFYQKLTGQTIFGEVRGVVVNRSDFDFSLVEMEISLLDANRNIIDASTTEIRTLTSGEEREFIVSWYYPLWQEPSSIEINAETNVFKSDNFLRVHGVIERFQEF